jgi:CRP/FNR family transcriptional regulator
VARSEGIFATLDVDELERVSRVIGSHNYKRGQVLFYEGNPCSAVFCVRSGLVKVSKAAPRDHQHILHLAGPGELLGLESLLANGKHAATGEMLENGVVCQIDRADLAEVLDRRGDVLHAIARRLARRLVRSERERSELASGDVRERLASTLMALASRFGAEDDGRIRIGVDLSREELAEMIGASTETAIRQLGEFRELGIVSTDGRAILVEDSSRLGRIAHVRSGEPPG